MNSTIVLAIPPEAQSRIRLIDLEAFLQERGLVVRAKITPDLVTLTAHAPEPRESDIAPVRANLSTFTRKVAKTPRVPPDGYDGPDAA